MEAEIDEIVKVAHVELQPVNRRIQVNFEAVANYVEAFDFLDDVGHVSNFITCLRLCFACQIVCTFKQIWERL